jgi:hypothetical protein
LKSQHFQFPTLWGKWLFEVHRAAAVGPRARACRLIGLLFESLDDESADEFEPTDDDQLALPTEIHNRLVAVLAERRRDKVRGRGSMTSLGNYLFV